jgi:hypothetical protein
MQVPASDAYAEPHCGTPSSIQAACTFPPILLSPIASIVVMRASPTEAMRGLAGADAMAVQMHSAGAALCSAAAELGAFQVERIPQHPEQRGFSIDIDTAFRAINFNGVIHGGLNTTASQL